MTISAKVIADSISPVGKRITTFALTYPRFIHAEFMTHRVFSRNAASSRAIPTKRFRKNVKTDMAMPIYFGKNQPGMSADEQVTGWQLWLGVRLIIWAGYTMCGLNWALEKLGFHKQVANRYLEPWFNITVICTSTEWGNFYHLRNHPKAQPEIKALAEAMLEAQLGSTPRFIDYGQWHLPYIADEELSFWGIEKAQLVSVARCARVSYLNHEGKVTTFGEDLKLYDRLLMEDPKHASPTEHQATPLRCYYESSGNFIGWKQLRKTIPNENMSVYSKLGNI